MSRKFIRYFPETGADVLLRVLANGLFIWEMGLKYVFDSFVLPKYNM